MVLLYLKKVDDEMRPYITRPILKDDGLLLYELSTVPSFALIFLQAEILDWLVLVDITESRTVPTHFIAIFLLKLIFKHFIEIHHPYYSLSRHLLNYRSIISTYFVCRPQKYFHEFNSIRVVRLILFIPFEEGKGEPKVNHEFDQSQKSRVKSTNARYSSLYFYFFYLLHYKKNYYK